MANRAIVTGANSGIGRATALALADAGWDVAITWHGDEGQARGTVEEIERRGRRAALRPLDLEDPETGPPIVDELADELGGLELFVNNAGIGHSTPFLELDLETWHRVVSVDLTGAFTCTQAAARRLVAQGRGGRIVTITSVHEHVPLTGYAAYCAAKGGLGMLTKAMALELAEHGINVNAIAPGEIATGEGVDPDGVERPWIPAGRPGHAREIGDTVVFLASEAARYITGRSIVVDGGMLLMAAEANRESW